MNAKQIDQEFASYLPQGDLSGSFVSNLVGTALADFDCNVDAADWTHEGTKGANVKSRVVTLMVEFWGMVAEVTVEQKIDRRPRRKRCTGATITAINTDDAGSFRAATGLYC